MTVNKYVNDEDDMDDEVLAPLSPLYARQPTAWQLLQPYQQRGIVAILSHQTFARAAVECGVETTTIHKWLRNPVFRAAYRECRAEVLQQALGALTAVAHTACETIYEIMTDTMNVPRDRLSAARLVLEYASRSVESDTMAARIEALERTLQSLEAGNNDESIAQ